jgi:uncharacterized protein YbaP (TraB family)
MKNRLKCMTALLSTLLLAVTLSASVVGAEEYREGLFWKIEKEGEFVGHVFGTLHMNDARIKDIYDRISLVLDDSQSFAMEAFPSDHYWNPYQGGQLIKHEMVLPRGDSLANYVGEETYAEIEQVLVDVLGMQPDLVSTLRPWAAMRSFAVKAKSNDVILDYALLERAGDQKKELFQVESIEEFIVTLQEMPIEAQVALLKFTVASYNDMQGIIDDMLDAYLQEDLEAMHSISTRFIPSAEENEQWRDVYLRHVIEIRNIVMAHYMRKPMRLGNTFIAVGAVHLFGEKGVLALIEKDGYTLTRVDL